MCGIVGYTGKRNAAPLIVEGLKCLEYRGYDSFGLAVMESGDGSAGHEDAAGKPTVIKKQGRISDAGSDVSVACGNIGIGHTRWATHGVPSDVNAHPHTDCSGDIAVVHNGIIENYAELKKVLIAEGHVFKSETDTEVIAHLLEKFCNTADADGLIGDEKIDFAVKNLMNTLEGSFALLILIRGFNGLIAIKRFSPLVLGIGDDELFASSDMTPILEHTQKILFLEDNDYAYLTPDGIRVFGYPSGEAVEREVKTVDWDVESAKKGGYEYFMEKEIFEQPAVFVNSFRQKIDDGAISVLKKASSITVVACGSSYHAGLIFRYLMEKYCKIPVRVEIASEFLNFTIAKGTAVIAVTQSGETADTLAALRHAKANGCPVFAVTNVLGSSVTRIADYVLYTRAGPEISVAATKSFTAQCAVLLRIVSLIGKGIFEKELFEIYPVLEETLLFDPADASAVCKDAENIFYVGRGVYYPISLEGALKMKEITYIHAEGCAAGELKHGPFSLLTPKTPVVAVCTKDDAYPVMISNIKEMKARGAPVIAIGSSGDKDLKEIADIFIPLPRSENICEVISATIILQMIAYNTAVLLGRDVDKPRNLAKSVTVI
ncbi:MAG: glutamine--fructose-6-phosphate transaminase (isomerizing) [Methanomicrobium sp.]|nr:glutamine--fructose-6-phosphate transaminase (isomerizing) [Methanomicrobium sp.]